MSSQKSTDELITRLALRPATRSLWPAFPVVPLIVCLTFGLFVVVAAGLYQWEWSALTNASLTMALIIALFGLTLCLEFASPTGSLDPFMGTVAAFVLVFSIGGLAQVPGLGRDQIVACYWLIVVMASPGLLMVLWLLRRGASLHPAMVGAGAGMFSSGIASLLFLLHCAVVPDGSGFHPEVAAMATASLIGAFVGMRVLKW